jgi:hypothetical protein
VPDGAYADVRVNESQQCKEHAALQVAAMIDGWLAGRINERLEASEKAAGKNLGAGRRLPGQAVQPARTCGGAAGAHATGCLWVRGVVQGLQEHGS